MSGWNSASTQNASTLRDIRESIGIPQFSGAAGENWAFVFNGLIFQGGMVNVPVGSGTFDFPAPYTQQLLGIFLQPTANHAFSVSATTLSDFTISHTGGVHDCYWIAVGV